MTRTTVVPEASPAALTGATILPGVPLPTWGRPEEPALPDPPPAPAPPARTVEVAAPPAEPPAPPPAPAEAPVPAVATTLTELAAPDATTDVLAAPDPATVVLAAPDPATVVLAAPDPATVVLAAPDPATVVLAPVEAEVRQPRSHRREASTAAPVATVAAMTVDADTPAGPLDAPVPQLAPPTPVPPRAEVYAAAGAAPPTAPWGPPPVEPADVGSASVEPVEQVEPVEPAAVAADDAVPVEPEDDLDQDQARPERPRRALLALGAVGGVLVLGAVAAFVWPGFLIAEDEPVSAPRPAVSVATTVALGAPDTAAGLTRVTGAPAAALAKAASGTTLSGYTAPVTAVYGTGATPTVTVIAWNAANRGADVSTAFAGFQQATGQAVTAIAPAATGTLGGRMSCGSSVVGTTPASVCFWADDATFGAVTVLRPTDATAGAATAVAIRAAMETRS